MTIHPVRDRDRQSGHRGATTVEMAFAVPILFVIVFGLIEVGHAFMVQHVIQDAARQGCRAAICPHNTNAAVISTVDALLRGEGIKKATTAILVNGSPGDIGAARTSDEISVQVTIAASDVSIVPSYCYLTGKLQGSFSL